MRSLATFAAALVLVGPAAAEARKQCVLVWDTDVTPPVGLVTTSPSSDLVSLAMGSGRSEVVVALRLARTFPDSADALQRLGSQVAVTFESSGVGWDLRAENPPGVAPGRINASGSVGEQQLDPKALRFSVEGNALVWRVARRAVPVLAKPRVVFTGFVATARSGISSDRMPESGRSNARYVDRAPSCVTAR